MQTAARISANPKHVHVRKVKRSPSAAQRAGRGGAVYRLGGGGCLQKLPAMPSVGLAPCSLSEAKAKVGMIANDDDPVATCVVASGGGSVSKARTRSSMTTTAMRPTTGAHRPADEPIRPIRVA